MTHWSNLLQVLNLWFSFSCECKCPQIMKYDLFSLKRNIHLLCLVQLIKQSILRILNFNFSNLRCCKVFLSFLRKELYWHFRVYCGNNLKLLPGKNTQKVNKQKKSLGFGIRNWLFDELNKIYDKSYWILIFLCEYVSFFSY